MFAYNLITLRATEHQQTLRQEATIERNWRLQRRQQQSHLVAHPVPRKP